MMSVQDAAAMVQGKAGGGNPVFTGVSTDTRTVRAGELFVALRGEKFDGHDFLDQAKKAGAVAAMVDRKFMAKSPLPTVAVEDTKLALGTMAKRWRSLFAPALIALTGSNGKTTVKEMLAGILRCNAGKDAVLATVGNLNNDIGLPLTLLRLRHEHRWCAIELGMNHKGEIAYLADIARPTVALVNNAQREHLEFMHSVDEVAAENASVYDAVPQHGVAVINADDGHAALFRKAAGKRRVIDFGLESEALVSGRYALKGLTSEIDVRTPAGESHATLAIPGLHNVRNAFAAAACAHAAGIDSRSIGEGLSAFRPYTGRLQIKQAGGATVIDDSYNANPDSVRAAIDVLATCHAPTILVLGDMGEVGEKGEQFHSEIGAYARSRNISSLYAIGDATKSSVAAFGAAGYHAKNIDDLLYGVKQSAVPGSTVLVKGSRFMKMERVVAALTGEAATGGAH